MSATWSSRRRWVFEKSRDPAWLWGSLIVILTLGLLGGLIAERFGGADLDARLQQAAAQPLPFGFGEVLGGDPASDAAFEAITQALAADPVDAPATLEAMAVLASELVQTRLPEVRAAIESAALDGPTRRIARLTFEAAVTAEGDPPVELIALAADEPMVPHANFAVGLLLEMRGRLAEALVALEREAARPEADAARARVVRLARQTHDLERLNRLEADPLYAEYFDARARLDTAIAARDWWRVLLFIVPSQYEHAQLRLIGLAALAGVAWFLLLAQLSQPASAWSIRVLLCLLAVLLGALSTVVTVFIIIVQEEVFGFVERDDLMGGLIYFVAGVGLREEVAKLLMFLPLVPILVRRGDELEMLIVAGCVGLGFAAEENVGYFHGMAGALNAPGRFLTANFLHLAMTGLIGLAFCRMFLYGRRGVAHFLQTFAGVVVLHGLYDALIVLPDLADLNFAAFFCLAGLAFWFFRELRGLRDTGRRDTLSPIATFVLGLSLLLAATLITLSAEIGLRLSVQALAPAAAELALIAYLFLREMPGSLVTV